MNYRIARILAEESLLASGTKTIDINVTEPISRIGIRYKYSKGSDGMAAHPAKDISKIELVSGSDVLHSLSGYENQALCIYDRKVSSMVYGQHLNYFSEEGQYGLDFGRYLWDPVLAFDPKKFVNPQLKITYDSDLSDALSTSPVLEVFGYLFDEKAISPVGFLMSKEHYSASCPDTDSYKYIDLPTDYPVRQLLLRAFEDGHEPWDAVKEAKLDEDNMKRIPFDFEIEEYYRMMRSVWQPIEEMLIGADDATGTTFYVTPTDYWCQVVGCSYVSAAHGFATLVNEGGQVLVTSEVADSFSAIVRGFMPNHCIQFPFGIQTDLDDWYDVTRIGSLRLRIRGGSSGTSAEFQVALQQLRRY